MSDLGKMLVGFGILLVIVGVILMLAGTFSGRESWIGRLPSAQSQQFQCLRGAVAKNGDTKRAALYCRVSTTGQTVENQRRELSHRLTVGISGSIRHWSQRHRDHRRRGARDPDLARARPVPSLATTTQYQNPIRRSTRKCAPYIGPTRPAASVPEPCGSETAGLA
jgi:hypothetical protein